MWVAAVLGFLSILSASVASAEGVPLDEYKKRRIALRESLGSAVTILFGANERDHGNLRSPFFQEPAFYYLTGWNEPGAILVLTPSTEVLMIPKRNVEQERWTGPKLAAEDAAAKQAAGFDSVLATEAFESNVDGWMESASRLCTLTQDPSTERLRRLLPLREPTDISSALARLRAVKSKDEIALIQRATDAGVEAHLAAWKRIAPDVAEYQIAATMGNVYLDKGCERHAYAPIVGTGLNGATLHYARNRSVLKAGELVLMDVGPECSMYATDITRTVPVSGKFTARQRELYEVVLGAQKAVMAAVKPGILLGNRATKAGLHKIATDYINSHGKDLHGKPLGQYFTHGLGHHVGLEVHDPNDPAVPLAAGMVITIEPGIYIPEEKIGIRIEDIVLVTENGVRNLSQKLPREIDEIERAMAR
jgi:Xaa-Pro aminopeptidase